MDYKGDILVGATIRGYFNTRTLAGVPVTLAGTPSLRVYKNDDTTEDDSGITLNVDFDGKTGLHCWEVDTSADGTFYSAGANFGVMIAAGTVDSVSVVGVCIAEFSIENRIVNSVKGSVGSVTGAVGSVTGAVGSVTGAVGSVTGLTASNLDTTVSSRATPAQVNTEVLDVINTDTFAEPTGVPGATVSLTAKIGRLYQALRNGITVTGSKKQYLDDSNAALWEKDLADDGTTYSETKGNAP